MVDFLKLRETRLQKGIREAKALKITKKTIQFKPTYDCTKDDWVNTKAKPDQPKGKKPTKVLYNTVSEDMHKAIKKVYTFIPEDNEAAQEDFKKLLGLKAEKRPKKKQKK